MDSPFNEKQLEAAKQIFESRDGLEDKLYVLYVAKRLLDLTYPFARDGVSIEISNSSGR